VAWGSSVVDRHRFDADPDPDFRFDSDVDSDPDWHKKDWQILSQVYTS
jgi:hypothetical protein